MDERLVTLAMQGEQRAFSEIAFAISGRLYALAYRILRDHDQAEDATQEALVSMWKSLPRLRETARFDAWASRVLVNACYVEARHARRRAATDIHALPDPQLARPPDLSVEDRDQLDRGFRRLPVEQRAVLVLQHYLGMDTDAIAELLGVPAGTVKSRASAARNAMRAALEADARGVAAQERSA